MKALSEVIHVKCKQADEDDHPHSKKLFERPKN
jgi:hypothetical protein